MKYPVYLYIAVMAIVTYLIRMLPLTLIKKEIKNPFIRSFLYYSLYMFITLKQRSKDVLLWNDTCYKTDKMFSDILFKTSGLLYGRIEVLHSDGLKPGIECRAILSSISVSSV